MVFDRRFGRIVAVVGLCFFARPLDCSADKVFLRSGQEEEGRIIDKNPEYIILYANGATKVLPSSDIVRIVEAEFSDPIPAQKEAEQAGAEGQANNVRASTTASCDLGFQALSKREIDSAIKFFDDAIRDDPNDAMAYQGRGMAHIIKGDKVENPMKKTEFSEALKDADEAVRLDPSDAPRRILRANALRRLGRLDEAIMDCGKALEIDPYFPGGYESRAKAYSRKKDYDSAINDYSKAIALSNSKEFYVSAFSERAEAYVKKGDLARAEGDCDRAMQLDPSYPFTHEVRAMIFAARKEYERAWAEVQKVQELGATVKPAFLEELKKNAPPS